MSNDDREQLAPLPLEIDLSDCREESPVPQSPSEAEREEARYAYFMEHGYAPKGSVLMDEAELVRLRSKSDELKRLMTKYGTMHYTMPGTSRATRFPRLPNATMQKTEEVGFMGYWKPVVQRNMFNRCVAWGVVILFAMSLFGMVFTALATVEDFCVNNFNESSFFGALVLVFGLFCGVSGLVFLIALDILYTNLLDEQ